MAALNLVQTVVIARLLEPADFGLMAAAMVVIALGGAFADAGLSSAVIARKTTPESLSSLYWLNLLAGALVCAVLIAVAPLVSAFFKEPRLEWVVRAAAPAFLIAPLGQQFDWLLRKTLRFRPVGLAQIIGAAFGTSVAIGTALLGAGVYSLIMGLLASSLATAIALMGVGLRQWKPMFRFRWSDVRPYLDFGLYQMGERTVNYLGANTDYLLIGRFLGSTALGTYSIAYQLVVKPVALINPMLNRVAFPVFAARADNDTLRRGYLHVVRLLAYVTFPLLLGLAVLAPEFVRVVLGPKWEASIPVLQVLCGVGLLRSLANPVGSVLLAKNRPDLGFKGNVVFSAAMAVVLLVSIHYGIMAVAWASLGVTFGAYVGWLLVLRRVVGLKLGEYVRALRAPFGFSVIMACCMTGLHLALSDVIAQPFLILLSVSAIGGLLYAAMLAAFEASYVRGLWRLFTGGGAPTASAEL